MILSYYYYGTVESPGGGHGAAVPLLLAEEKDATGKVKKVYVNDGEGIIGMVRAIYDDSGVFSHYQRLYYLYDSLGSVSYITGENGLPLQNYAYSPYGTCLNVTDDPINNLQFVGRYGGYKDNDSGLTYFWHRWYDSYDGRWVSRDPIGTKGDENLYRVVGNQAVNQIDPTGLLWLVRGDGTSFYIDTWKFWIPHYGNYCGPSWANGTYLPLPEENKFTKGPINGMDNCCLDHDICSYKVRMGMSDGCGKMKQSDCDKQLSKCFFDNWITNPPYGIVGGLGFAAMGGGIGGGCGSK